MSIIKSTQNLSNLCYTINMWHKIIQIFLAIMLKCFKSGLVLQYLMLQWKGGSCINTILECYETLQSTLNLVWKPFSNSVLKTPFNCNIPFQSHPVPALISMLRLDPWLWKLSLSPLRSMSSVFFKALQRMMLKFHSKFQFLQLYSICRGTHSNTFKHLGVRSWGAYCLMMSYYTHCE